MNEWPPIRCKQHRNNSRPRSCVEGLQGPRLQVRGLRIFEAFKHVLALPTRYRSSKWGFMKKGAPKKDPQIVGFPYNWEPKKLPLISETPKSLAPHYLGPKATHERTVLQTCPGEGRFQASCHVPYLHVSSLIGPSIDSPQLP